jgi:hypothetical protein
VLWLKDLKQKLRKKSLAIREQLNIKYNGSLDCFKLVDYLDIPTYPVDKMGEFGLSTDHINTICYSEGKQQFSATTISVPFGHLIFYNQSHTLERSNSTLAHEASHIILGHEFSSISDIKYVSREFDKDKKDEANWIMELHVSHVPHLPSYNLENEYGLRNHLWSAYFLFEWDEASEMLLLMLTNTETLSLNGFRSLTNHISSQTTCLTSIHKI